VGRAGGGPRHPHQQQAPAASRQRVRRVAADDVRVSWQLLTLTPTRPVFSVVCAVCGAVHTLSDVSSLMVLASMLIDYNTKHWMPVCGHTLCDFSERKWLLRGTASSLSELFLWKEVIVERHHFTISITSLPDIVAVSADGFSCPVNLCWNSVLPVQVLFFTFSVTRIFASVNHGL
jgi:hypothetical protein